MKGEDILPVARARVGDVYVFGAIVTYTNASWKGPWDCAEFATWCVYQAYGFFFGCDGKGTPGSAYTGQWRTDSRTRGRIVPVAEAIATPGALLLRYPGSGADGIGHIVISQGDGRTLEAADTRRGVVVGQVAGRRWDAGVLLPGVDYALSSAVGSDVLRYEELPNPTQPVRRMQMALQEAGFDPGPADGLFSRATESALASFQLVRGLLVDGECGSQTSASLFGVAAPARAAATPTAPPTVPAPTSDPAALQSEYAVMFAALAGQKPGTEVVAAADRVGSNRARYEAVGNALGVVPWYAIGLVNELESTTNFTTHLHNGDPLGARTVHVPAGRPPLGDPPFTWEASAEDALRLERWDHYDEWSLTSTLYRLEKYNGFGTRRHGVFTPYLWAGSDFYRSGKYRADETWDPSLVSKQAGCAVILAELMRRGSVSIEVS